MSCLLIAGETFLDPKVVGVLLPFLEGLPTGAESRLSTALANIMLAVMDAGDCERVL